ncbi:YtpI family protein [Cytobacillus sp. IB215316]|uniref:YtpI family protein n=1 Tax=Cytobacillus sp. IB215316 TaxID=3097354 RepID=UPI002A17431B|nr:YtpI family protein [Cytobacillus sp. IB215316]MDX8359303.1 YtpI family protein [Cytobacillus sp. IB215316]
MPVFVIFIVLSISFYLFYKIKYFRTKRPIERQWISSKSSIALGTFVLLFAINQLILFPTTITFIVGTILILFGGGSIWAGYRAYKYFLPLAIKEAEELK